MNETNSGKGRPGASAIRIGCAGWALRKEHFHLFPSEGSHLGRYAGCLPAVEINSSFYRPHRPATYARWAATVPDHFRFAVKMPKQLTHTHRLVEGIETLERFLPEATSLGEKLGPLLVQLPPSLSFSIAVAQKFFADLRRRFHGDVALEPRHATWFEAEAERLITSYRIARVAADPAVVSAALRPGGWDGLVYYRLHGSPQIYHSDYSDEYLAALSEKLSKETRATNVWCIFDNTADGAATVNALDLLKITACRNHLQQDSDDQRLRSGLATARVPSRQPSSPAIAKIKRGEQKQI